MYGLTHMFQQDRVYILKPLQMMWFQAGIRSISRLYHSCQLRRGDIRYQLH